MRRSNKGSVVMDSGMTTKVIKPNDRQLIMETDIASNKIFTVAKEGKCKTVTGKSYTIDYEGRQEWTTSCQTYTIIH
jgi:hypothetical protein